MSKTLIIYHSRYGQTGKVAQRICDVLTSANLQVDLIHVDSAGDVQSLKEYDVVIMGGPIYTARHSKSLAQFIRKFRSELEQVPTGFFSVSLSAAGRGDQQADAVRCLNEFLAEVDFEPTIKTIIAGAVAYRRYNWFLRSLMKRIVRRAGGDTDTTRDHEYTDWKQVDDFARKIVRQPPDSQADTATLETMYAQQPPAW